MFRMSINGVSINDLPEALMNSKIKIKRDSKLKFLSANYIADLVFNGDAYSVILAAANLYSNCGFIDAVIEKKCGQNWNLYFAGVIDLSTIEHNLSRCWIKTNIEDENLSSLIINRKSIAVPAKASKSISGVPIPTISDYGISITNYDIAWTVNRNVWNAFNVLSHIVSYITDGKVIVVSDFFQITTSQLEEWLYYQAPNTSISFNWTDPFGQSSSLFWPYPPSHTVNERASAIGYQVSDQPYDFNRGFMFSGTTGNTVVLRSPLEMGLTPFTYLFSSLTKSQTLVRGGKNLAITNGERLRNGGLQTDLELSFEDLFLELDHIFNLSFRMENVNGQIYMRLEPLEYFFTNSNILNLDSIPELIQTSNNEFSYSFLTTGESAGLLPATRLQSWVSEADCATDSKNIETKYITDANAIDTQVSASNDNNDTSIYLLETEFNAGTFRATIYYTTEWMPSFLNRLLVYKNAMIMNYNRIKNHMFGGASDYRREGRVLINNSPIIFSKEISFETALNESQIQSLISGQTDFITYSDGRGNSGKGWILDVEIDNKNGISTFKLLTE